MCWVVQNFFRSYPKLAGMTGTAATESAEFATTYDLTVTVVPTNRVRLAHPAQFYWET